MWRKIYSISIVTGLAVNVLLASPSPINSLPEYELRHAGEGAQLFDGNAPVNRLRGRKRRTPADFVRQFDSSVAPQVAAIAVAA